MVFAQHEAAMVTRVRRRHPHGTHALISTHAHAVHRHGVHGVDTLHGVGQHRRRTHRAQSAHGRRDRTHLHRRCRMRQGLLQIRGGRRAD